MAGIDFGKSNVMEPVGVTGKKPVATKRQRPATGARRARKSTAFKKAHLVCPVCSEKYAGKVHCPVCKVLLIPRQRYARRTDGTVERPTMTVKK